MGVPIYRSRPFLPIRKYSLLADYPSVSKHLAHLAPDVVYTRTSTPLVGFAARYCQRYQKALVYHIAHASDVVPPREKGRRAFLKKLQRPIYEYGLKRAGIIVAQADYQASALKYNYGLDATAVIPNFHPIPDPVSSVANSPTVLWVANLKPAKRPEIFVDLARHFAGRENLRFVMVGAVQDPAYEYLLDRAGWPDNFTFLGHQSVDEVNQLLSNAALFVNTSRADGEGFPNTFIQAWLHAVPVLSLEMDPDSVLTRLGLGECFDGDIARLERGLDALLENLIRRREMGQRARIYAVEQHGERNCETLIRLIETHAGRPRS